MDKEIIGWQEYCSLPKLGIKQIRAKIDSGAKTSCLHAFDIQEYQKHGQNYVSFLINPKRTKKDHIIKCEAPMLEHRIVSNSGGKREKRCVIVTEIDMGGQSWNIEVTLTSRHTMKCMMLLGREALSNRFIIDTQKKFLFGRVKKNIKKKT